MYAEGLMVWFVFGYRFNSTGMTSSFQTEHQLQSSHSSFNTYTISVRVGKSSTKSTR